MTSRTVLLVDDSKVARMLARAIIEKAYPDWRVVEATSGEEAVAHAADQPDYIFLDVNMPGIGGLAAVHDLQAGCPKAAITLLTANIQDSTRRQAAELGIGFMAKPISQDAILAFLGSAGEGDG